MSIEIDKAIAEIEKWKKDFLESPKTDNGDIEHLSLVARLGELKRLAVKNFGLKSHQYDKVSNLTIFKDMFPYLSRLGVGAHYNLIQQLFIYANNWIDDLRSPEYEQPLVTLKSSINSESESSAEGDNSMNNTQKIELIREWITLAESTLDKGHEKAPSVIQMKRVLSKAAVLILRISDPESKQCKFVIENKPLEEIIHGEGLDRQSTLNELNQMLNVFEQWYIDLSATTKPQEDNTMARSDQHQAHKIPSYKCFIVHGHDDSLKKDVALFLHGEDFSGRKIEPIILNEQVDDEVLTIKEKFSKYSDVDFAICLWTADDLGKGKTDTNLKPRARQNVILETGYLWMKLKGRLFIIRDEGVEIPSDLKGVEYCDSKDNWELKLIKKIKVIYNKLDPKK